MKGRPGDRAAFFVVGGLATADGHGVALSPCHC